MDEPDKTVIGPGKVPVRSTPDEDKFLASLSVQPQDLSGDNMLSLVPRAQIAALNVPAIAGIPLFARIGRGGMGAVYYGVHPRLKKEVAVKIMTLEGGKSSPAAERFFREAQIAANLQSPNLIAVLDVNEERGLFFIVMEYVSGMSAGGFLKRLNEDGKLGLDELSALDICIAATEGLASAHDADIIHRDIKPDNIMIPYDKRGNLALSKAKLADLGLARSQNHSAAQSLTGDNVVGTLGYMSPEQTRSARLVKKPSDVFSMGATLYALLTGRAPFTGESAIEIILATVQSFPKLVTKYRNDISAETLALIDRCLSKNDSDRPADAAELLSALRECRQVRATPSKDLAELERTIIGPIVRATPFFEADTVLKTLACPPPPAPAKAHETKKANVARPTIAAAAERSQPKKSSPQQSSVGVLSLVGLAAIALCVVGYFVFGNKKVENTPIAGVSTTSTVEPAKKAGDSPVAFDQAAFNAEVAKLPREEQVKRVVDELKQLNPKDDIIEVHDPKEKPITGLTIQAKLMKDIRPISALTWLNYLALWGPGGPNENSGLEDISPLAGLINLKTLDLGSNPIADISPIANLQNLTDFLARYSKIGNIEAFRGMKLKCVVLVGAKIKDYSVLENMPIDFLSLYFCHIDDSSFLRKLPAIETLNADLKYSRDKEIIQSLKAIKFINDKPAAQWIADEEAKVQKGTKAEPIAENPDDPGRWKKAIDLLPLIDLKKDTVSGEWIRDGDTFRQKNEWSLTQSAIPYLPPDEYDLRITFEPKQTGFIDLHVLVPGYNGNRGYITLHQQHGRNGYFGFMFYEGHHVDDKDNSAATRIEAIASGVHEIIVQVRRAKLIGILDSKIIVSGKVSLDLGHPNPWPDDYKLGIGMQNNAVFQRVQLLEVTGRGTFTRPDDPAAKKAAELLKAVPEKRGEFDQAAFNAEVAKLPREEQVKRVVEELKRLNPDSTVKATYDFKQNLGVIFEASLIKDIRPVSSLKWLTGLSLFGPGGPNDHSGVEDISTLASLENLEVLDLGSNNITDVSPLKSLPRLKEFTAGRWSKLENIEPLRGMHLSSIRFNGLYIKDYSPLENMPLKWLLLYSDVEDFSFLQKLPELEHITATSLRYQRDKQILQSLKLLKRINNKLAAQWIADEEAKIEAAKRNLMTGEALVGTPSDPARWKNAIDLLLLTDLTKDVIQGDWESKGTTVILSSTTKGPRFEIPYKLPAEFDVALQFECTPDSLDINLIVNAEPRKFNIKIISNPDHSFHFAIENFESKNIERTDDKFKKGIDGLNTSIGTKHLLMIQIRQNDLTAFLNGKEIAHFAPLDDSVTRNDFWKLNTDGVIGVGSCFPIKIDRVQILEITGHGTFTRPDDPAAKKAAELLKAASEKK